jgi:nicotinamidase-related amidase/YHS domain-containing protein
MTDAPLAINTTCPWSGSPVAADSLTRYRGQTVGFCNPDCRDKFDRATAHFDAAMPAAGRTLLQFGDAVPPQPVLGDSVLIVIDAQEEYRSGGLPLSGIEASLARLAALLVAARAAGATVLHIAHRGSAGALFDPEGHGAIMPEVAPQLGEPVIWKPEPSAFTGTDLGTRLEALGARSLILAGFMTHLCVSSTAREAMERGYVVTVAADATATRPLPDPLGGPDVSAAELQRAALTALADCFARIDTVAALLAG